MFYGLVGLGKPKTAWLRGGALGLAMGIGAVMLPETLGLGNDTTARTPTTKRVQSRGIFWVACLQRLRSQPLTGTPKLVWALKRIGIAGHLLFKNTNVVPNLQPAAYAAEHVCILGGILGYTGVSCDMR